MALFLDAPPPVTQTPAPPPPADPLAKVRTGEQTEITVGPSGDEGLWNMAQDINKELNANMQKTNSVEVIFGKLRDNAVSQGFKKGSDDGHLPSTYQGDQKSGRDLDLIYAQDKFKIDLNKPEGGAPPPTTEAPPPGTDVQKLGLDPKNQGAWDDMRGKNPQFDAQFKGLDPDVQRGFVGSFNQAVAKDAKDKDAKQVEQLGQLLQSDGFKDLGKEHQVKALQLADKAGAGAAKELVNDAGFRTLKDTKVQSLDDDENRNAQTLVLDKAIDDPVFLKALQNGLRGENGAQKIGDAYQGGQAMMFMAMYVGRGNGYAKISDQPTTPAQRAEALQKLWTNVIAQPRFAHANYLDQNIQINSWVEQRGFVNQDVRPR